MNHEDQGIDKYIPHVKHVLAHYDIGEFRSLSRLRSGYANINFRLTTTLGDFLLRMCSEKPEHEILHEMNVLERLKREGFPAAYPMRRNDNGFITSGEFGNMVIYQYIQGREPVLNGETVKEIAVAVARLNTLDNWESLRKENAIGLGLCNDVMSRFERAPNRYPGIFEYFRREMEYLSGPLEEDLPVGLIHGDAFPDNTIYGGKKLLAIVDWEEVCTDRLLIDVGVTINGFCFVNNRLDMRLLDTFLEYYEEVRKLSRKELELLPYYIRWGSDAMIAWHLKHLLYSTDTRKMERVMMFVERVRGLRI